MHLAIGGYTLDDGTSLDPESFISDSNGDMGENETAGFDPIFYFHHCWIDRVFWKWQVLHKATTHFEIDKDDHGARPSSLDKFNV